MTAPYTPPWATQGPTGMLPQQPQPGIDPNTGLPFQGGGDLGAFGPIQGINNPAPGQASGDGTFSAQNNLINAQFDPNNPQAQETLGQAKQAIQGAQLGPLQPLNPNVGQAEQATMSALGALGSAPNRQQLAEQEYGALANQDTANTQKLLQQAGQQNAAFGTLGSGMQAAGIGDIFGQHEANLGSIKAQLAAQTGGQIQSDLLNNVGAAQGVTSTLGGLGQGEQALGLQQGQAQANLGLAQGGALAGIGSQQYGQNLGNLGFQQGQQRYQAGLSQQAYDNALAAAGLTQPSPLGAQIGGAYSNLGQQQMAGAGNTLATLFGLGG